MSTPLTATWRLKTSYTIQGQAHKLIQYVKASLVAGSYVLTQRDGVTTTALATAISVLASAMGYQYAATDLTAISTVLEERSGTVWTPRASGSGTVSGISSVSAILSSQITWVFRDTAANKVKVVLMEPYFPLPYHWTAPGALSGNMATAYKAWTATGGGTFTNHPGLWQVGRSNLYLMPDPLVGVTGDLNDKLRRNRNLV